MRGSVRNSRQATKLLGHIRELQRRLLISVFALVVVGIAVYVFYEPILDLLRSPLGAPLFYNSPAGSFSFVMKICFMGALAITIPIIVFNLIMFVRPAFKEAIPIRRVFLTSALSSVLAFAGAVFGFYYIIPGALRFFAGFQVDGLSALISADNYLGFVTNVIITFVLIFQLPLLISFIDRIKPISPKKLIGGEKWVILCSLIISALVPFAFDLTTSILISLPIIILYNLLIIIILLQHANAKRKANIQLNIDLSNMPESTLSISELSFEDLLGQELAMSITAAEATKPRRPGIDIVPLNSAPAAVKPADWVNKVHDPIPIDPRSRLITS